MSPSWPIQDIIYIAVVGTIMLAALLEWILWLLAYLYCLVKVYQKAQGEGQIGIRILAVLNIVFFTLMRCIFLPIMLVTLPLPPEIVQCFPREMIADMQWFAFWTFAGLLVVPWLFCVYQLVTHNVGRRKRIKTILDEWTAPKVVIVLPCYMETPEILLRTVDSLVGCDYPTTCLHIFLSFDGDAENELYLRTIEKLGVPLTLDSYPKSIDVCYRDCRITVSRFPHGGKRSCQKKTFKLIDKIYINYLCRNDDLFLLFIDSDCILDKNCMKNFMYEMELKPGMERKMLAMTGVITSTSEKNSLITVLQDMEYIHGQLFERSVESGCGAVTCLPGALTILRFSAFRRMAKYYFADKAEQCDDLFDYGKCHLGEDRWLTHLFMIGAQHRYQIQMNTGAFCKTEAVQTFKSLLKQRRRWFLGFITNEACMLTDIRLWKRYPLLVLIRLAQNTIRTTALLFFIMIISILTTAETLTNLPVGFIAVSLGLNWVLMLYFGAKLGRYKIMLYPLMFVVNPFFNWLYMVYGIFTAGQRTWGGPRADAGKADEGITPEQAVEKAAAQGDELNVVPETFKPAIEATKHKIAHSAPLQPAGHLQGRFAPAAETTEGLYRQENDSGVLRADMTARFVEEGVYYRRGPRRDSSDSVYSTMSSISSTYMPRRIESVCGVHGVVEQPGQQDHTDGVETEALAVNTDGDDQGRPYPYVESVRSSRSNSSVSLHFEVPPRSPSRDQPTATQQVPRPNHLDPMPGRPPALPLPSQQPQTSNPPLTLQNVRFTQTPQSRGARRSARSPLARKSFMHLASEEAGSSAGEGGTMPGLRRRRYSEGDESRHRGRWSVSMDRGGERRLRRLRNAASEA